MSHDTHEAHDSHEGPIKTPKQLAWAVFFAFVVPIVVIILLANYVSGQFKPAAGSDSLEAEKIAERLKPVGHVEVKAAGDMAAMKTGEQVYQAQCAACHTSGAAGAWTTGAASASGSSSCAPSASEAGRSSFMRPALPVLRCGSCPRRCGACRPRSSRPLPG